MNEPIRGEVRRGPKGRVYYIQGPYVPDLDPGPAGAIIQPTISLTNVIEVEGQFVGQRYAVATDIVRDWKVVSRSTSEVDRYYQALVDIAGYEAWQGHPWPSEIAARALET